MERTQSQYDRVAAIFFLIIGGFFAFYARSVEIGTWQEPGPGFLPFWAGITIAIMSFALLLGNLKKRGPACFSLISWKHSCPKVSWGFRSRDGSSKSYPAGRPSPLHAGEYFLLLCRG